MKDKNNNLKYKKGAAMLVAVLFFLFASMAVIVGVITPIIKQASLSKSVVFSKSSFYLAQGSVEDVFYRLKNNKQLSGTESLSLNGATVSTVISNTAVGKKVSSVGTHVNSVRKVELNLALGTGIAFYYGVQAGQGGFELQNSSSITGNVYSGGPVTGSNNMIYGNVVSSGSSGLIEGIHATGTAWAHTIKDSTIDKDAHYTVKTNTTVGGVSYPSSPDLDDAPLPISDEQIDEWESDAATGGTASCTGGKYTISSNTTLGPKKIPCDLEINGSTTLTLTGHLWVTGNVTAKNSSIIKLDSSLGNKSLVIISDNPSNRTTSSKISIENSSSFQNSGTVGSFVFLISQNNSGELGGEEEAISNANSSGGAVVLYAPHGFIELQNSINVKEVTAYKILLKNSANVKYDTGLPSSLFDSGPGGGYDVLDWKEVQ